MADDDKDRNGLPEGWRPEWRKPAPRRRTGGARARARGLVAVPDTTAQPIPSAQEIHDRAVRTLLAIAEDETAQPTARVGAARGLLEVSTAGERGGRHLAELTDEEIDARLAQIRRRLQLAGASESVSALSAVPAVLSGTEKGSPSGEAPDAEENDP